MNTGERESTEMEETKKKDPEDLNGFDPFISQGDCTEQIWQLRSIMSLMTHILFNFNPKPVTTRAC